MPRDFYVELSWYCANGHKNRGEDTVCKDCGKPKTDVDGDVMPANISEADAVTDSKKLKHAKAGAMWKCRFCGSAERRDDGNCAQCGVDQTQGEKKEDGRAETPTTPYVASPAPAYEVQPYTAPRRQRSLLPWIFGVALVGVVLCLWLLFRTKELHGTVTALGWQRTIHIDRYSLNHHEGFNEDGAEQNGVLNLRILDTHRFHGTAFHQLVGHHTVTSADICGKKNCRKGPKHDCYTPKASCKKQKNGFARCTQPDDVCKQDDVCDAKTCEVNDYVDLPTYATFYAWDMWEWHHNRDAQLDGTSLQVQWPDTTSPALADGEREQEHGREESYSVNLTGRLGDTWTYHPDSEQEFQRFPMGGRHLIKVNAVGSVTVEN